MPDGRNLRSVISPTGSGSAAMASSPVAIAAIVLASSVRRSTNAASWPAASAAATSSALAAASASASSLQRGGHRRQRGILRPRVGPRRVAGGAARGCADALHVGADVGESPEAGHGEIGHRTIVARSWERGPRFRRRTPVEVKICQLFGRARSPPASDIARIHRFAPTSHRRNSNAHIDRKHRIRGSRCARAARARPDRNRGRRQRPRRRGRRRDRQGHRDDHGDRRRHARGEAQRVRGAGSSR